MAGRMLLCLSAVLATAFAGAAEVLAQERAARPTPKSQSMKVVIVRSSEPGCEPNCAEWIAAQGQIDETTPAEFRRVLARLGHRKLPVLIDSIGGDVDASLTVGRMIRARNLDVVVTKTAIDPCDPALAHCRAQAVHGVARGRPDVRVSKCASACAFVLAGGVKRYVGAWAVVGLHEIKSISTMRLVRQHYRMERKSASETASPRKHILKEEVLRVETSEAPAEEATYEKVQRYFNEMGVDPSIMPILRAAPNSSIRWVRATELKATALATDFLNGEQLLLFRPTAAPTVIPLPKDTTCAATPCAGAIALAPENAATPQDQQPRTTLAPIPDTTSTVKIRRQRAAASRRAVERAQQFPAFPN